jgi:pimeloyl-ACP methyl ester carboxylesterase
MAPSLDERAFIERVEAMEPDAFARLLARPSRDEEKALRVYFGDARFEHLHTLAVQPPTTRGSRETRGHVVVLHGIMGGELSEHVGNAASRIWLNMLGLVRGQLDRLRMDAHGRSVFDVRASGILKRYYGELLTSLTRHWTVRTFWYDWRQDIHVTASALMSRLRLTFPKGTPVHFVCHSMGGLVARTFIRDYREYWDAMRGASSDGPGSRLVMIGTPNHGSFEALQGILGLGSMVRRLALVDLSHSHTALRELLNTFVGTYQMLPSPLKLPELEPLYRADTYKEVLHVSQARLDAARELHEQLASVVEPDRMLYIAGTNKPTLGGLKHLHLMARADAYTSTFAGDGTVPHALGLLEGVPTWYVKEEHATLTRNPQVLQALDELLATGRTQVLPQSAQALRAAPDDEAGAQVALAERDRKEEVEIRRLSERLQAISVRGLSPPYLLQDEARLQELVAGVSPEVLQEPSARVQEEREARAREATERLQVEVALLHGEIQALDGVGPAEMPVDAIAVGHYLGVTPQRAELALDVAISRAYASGSSEQAPLVLTQLAERGIIRGDIGQPFFLSDPRKPERLIVLAGMGIPGRFGISELTVTVRELYWSLNRLGKKHLATVLIGGGEGNLAIPEALRAWIRGVHLAAEGADVRCLQRITFVERDSKKARAMQEALLKEQERLAQGGRLELRFTPLSEEELSRALPASSEPLAPALRSKPLPPATRVTLSLDRHRKTYHFGAITEGAAVPERQVSIDPKLIEQVNEELAAERTCARQLYQGQFLERLLIPTELRQEFYRYQENPVVLLVDATMARIHWEALARSDVEAPDRSLLDESEATLDYFLGTSRGLTRQLRTMLAPPLDPPPPSRRVLRVLIVADPAEDAPLPGAMQEGFEVAGLFEHFNTLHGASRNRVEVVRLFGPHDATRTNVLRHLLMRTEPYDVLHFAGHCEFDEKEPLASGWIFSGGERLTAHELRRLDRVPPFVFSNACESGITPDRSELRSAALAPSFAESFFERGVSNFVCTAWPVDDFASRQFALTLYAHLLGLKLSPEGPPEPGQAVPMYLAMQQARRAIATTSRGTQTWAAYQHYGSPFFRFFDPAALASQV